METLIEGVERYHSSVRQDKAELFEKLDSGQSPKTLLIGCSDSRVVPELITSSEPGDLFVIRNAGNIVPPWQTTNGGITATIEYAVVGLGVTDIVICGHSQCGAMKAFSAGPGDLDAMPAVKDWIVHSQAANLAAREKSAGKDDAQTLTILVEENVKTQIGHLKSHPSVAAAQARGDLRLHGWVFEIKTGEVRALDGSDGTFKPFGADGAYAVADLGNDKRA